MDIKILGKGCKKCKLLEANVKKAVDKLGIDATIDKVTDIDEIADYGVMSTPGLVVDGDVKLAGKIASAKKLESILR